MPRAADLPHLHAFTRGLGLDRDAVRAAVTLPYHNSGTKASTQKRNGSWIKCAKFALLRHCILLG